MRKKRPLEIGILFVLSLFLLSFPTQGDAQVYYVNCDEGQTLQPVIRTGRTIYVTGTCNENISVTDGVTLDVYGTATINGPNTTSLSTVEARGNAIRIRGFTITGGQNGIFIFRDSLVTIDGNTIESTGGHGIVITQNALQARIINNTIRNNPKDGINVTENSVARIGIYSSNDTVASPNTIENNGGNGITVTRSSSAHIVGNTISNNGGEGISVNRVSQADISSNTINGNNQNGILVTQNSGVNLGNDTGDTIFDLPNGTTVKNGLFGLLGAMGGYADGNLGTLDGLKGEVFFDLRSIRSSFPK